MGRLLGLAVIAVGVAIGFAAAPAGASGEAGLAAPGARSSAAPGTGAVAPGAGRPRLVTLINGDRLLASAVPGGGISHELIAGTAGGVNAALASMRLGGRIYVIPADAVPYLGRGLNADLFDVGRLLRDQVHDRLPVEVQLRGARAIPAGSDDYLRSRRDRPRLPDRRVGEGVRRRACPPVHRRPRPRQLRAGRAVRRPRIDLIAWRGGPATGGTADGGPSLPDAHPHGHRRPTWPANPTPVTRC